MLTEDLAFIFVPSALGLAAFAALTSCGALGCVDTQLAVGGANQARAVGFETSAAVDELCTFPAERALKLDEAGAARELERLRGMHCPQALLAQTAYSKAHATVHALIEAIEAGQCRATLARDVGDRCDLLEATEQLAGATAVLLAAAERLKGAE